MCFQGFAFGQSFLNGSFETTTGNCNYGLTNTNFDSLMTSNFAFGSASQIDIMHNTCGFGAAQQGNYFIGIAVAPNNVLTDALSLKVSSTLIAGNTYSINFYNKQDIGYSANLLEVGYSADSVTFGISIDTAALPTNSWGLVSFSFTPVINCQFITIRTIAGSYGWNLVDNFTISETTDISENLVDEHAIQIYPNPASDFISIRADESIKIISTKIRDIQGKTILVSDKTTFSLPEFDAGVFILEINTNKGRVVERIILE